jgi:hypothetical protein
MRRAWCEMHHYCFHGVCPLAGNGIHGKFEWERMTQQRKCCRPALSTP